jgi:predicted small lipoprotein YifL
VIIRRPQRTLSPASFALVALLLAAQAACGKKGPPLEPLRLVPANVPEVSARRSGQDVELRFTLPTTNANGPGDIDLDHVEIYAITVGAGSVPPPNRDLLTKARVVGTIAVRPAPVEGAPDPPATDKRPAPGEQVMFVETLTEAKLEPVPTAVAAAPVPPAAAAPAAPAPGAPGAIPPVAPLPDASAQAPAAANQASGEKPRPEGAAPAAPAATPAPAPAPTTVTQPTRIYAIRGVSRGGRPGPPSPRVSVPLVSPVAAPSAVVARMPTEKAIVVDWTPPVAEPGGASLTFNVYRREETGKPLNQAPVTDIKFEVPGVEYGKEHCFVVRAIQRLQNVTIESDTSAPACLTPADAFPPAAPQGLRGVAEDGAVNLVWDPNAEADLGGYVVLRGESPGETLLPITPEPIKDASYRDTTVQPGVRYVYAVVAVDTAASRNTSARSAPEAVTAR